MLTSTRRGTRPEYCMRAPMLLTSVASFLVLAGSIASAQTPDVEALNREGAVLVSQRKYPEAEAKLSQARTACEAAGETHQCSEYASVLNNLGSLYFSTVKYREAEPLLEQAVAVSSDRPADEAVLEKALHNLAAVYRAEVRYAQALPVYERALSLRESREGSDAFALLPILNGFALLQRDLGENQRSGEITERALSIAELNRERKSTDAADGFGTLGELLELQGRLAEAETWLGQALAIRERLFGPASPATLATLNSLALVYRGEGKSAEAEECYGRALKVEAGRVPETLLNLGRAFFDQGRLKEAERAFRQAIAQAEQQFGPSHRDVAAGLNDLALLLISRRKFDEAESALRRALDIDTKHSSDDDPRIAADLSNLASLSFARKRYADAERLLGQADAILRKRFPANHPEVAKVMAGLAEIRNTQGRLDESEELYRRAVEILEQAW